MSALTTNPYPCPTCDTEIDVDLADPPAAIPCPECGAVLTLEIDGDVSDTGMPQDASYLVVAK